MLDISNVKIAKVIFLAREGRAYERQLKGFIGELNEDEKASLTAVMWVGRESYEPEDIEAAKQTALEEATVPTEDYLTQEPLLADYLEAGLDALGVDVADVEDDLL